MTSLSTAKTLNQFLLVLTLKKESIIKQYTKTKALLESLKTIPDYRDTEKVEYPLAEVLFSQS